MANSDAISSGDNEDDAVNPFGEPAPTELQLNRMAASLAWLVETYGSQCGLILAGADAEDGVLRPMIRIGEGSDQVLAFAALIEN